MAISITIEQGDRLWVPHLRSPGGRWYTVVEDPQPGQYTTLQDDDGLVRMISVPALVSDFLERLAWFDRQTMARKFGAIAAEDTVMTIMEAVPRDGLGPFRPYVPSQQAAAERLVQRGVLQRVDSPSFQPCGYLPSDRAPSVEPGPPEGQTAPQTGG